MNLRLVVLFSTAIALPVFAHDPSMHKDGDAKGPDCAQMEKMDTSKMSPNDPVMKALHAKCAANITHEEMIHRHVQGDAMRGPGQEMSKDKSPSPDSHSDMH